MPIITRNSSTRRAHTHSPQVGIPRAKIRQGGTKGQTQDRSDATASSVNSSVKLCKSRAEAAFQACSVENTITVVLTVWKREQSLKRQLRKIMDQSKRPSRIIVVQNGKHVDIDNTIVIFKLEHPDMMIDTVSFSGNSRYHARFHLAYLLAKSEYVSLWDDDVNPGKEWLKYCIQQSKIHGDALVGGNARMLGRIMSAAPNSSADVEQAFAKQIGFDGGSLQHGNRSLVVDFVGHSWTLKREHLRYFLGERQFTYTTGEDLQLSFALKKHGIETWFPRQAFPSQSLADFVDLAHDRHASHLNDKQIIRQLLYCQVLQAGLGPRNCTNCGQTNVNNCVDYFTRQMQRMRPDAEG